MLRLMCSPCDDEMIDRSKESGIQGMHYWVTGKDKAAISGCLRSGHFPDSAVGTKNPMAQIPLNALLCADVMMAAYPGIFFTVLEPENSKLRLMSLHVMMR